MSNVLSNGNRGARVTEVDPETQEIVFELEDVYKRQIMHLQMRGDDLYPTRGEEPYIWEYLSFVNTTNTKEMCIRDSRLHSWDFIPIRWLTSYNRKWQTV